MINFVTSHNIFFSDKGPSCCAQVFFYFSFSVVFSFKRRHVAWSQYIGTKRKVAPCGCLMLVPCRRTVPGHGQEPVVLFLRTQSVVSGFAPADIRRTVGCHQSSVGVGGFSDNKSYVV